MVNGCLYTVNLLVLVLLMDRSEQLIRLMVKIGKSNTTLTPLGVEPMDQVVIQVQLRHRITPMHFGLILAINGLVLGDDLLIPMMNLVGMANRGYYPWM